MTIALFDPYGSRCAESGFMVVMARYLNKRGFALASLRCSGILSNCANLLAASSERYSSCLNCMSEHDKNMSWSEVPSIDLSRYFTSEDNHALSLQVSRTLAVAKPDFRVEGVHFNDVVPTEYFVKLSHARQAASMLEFARIVTAFSILFSERQFDGVFVPVGQDIYLKSFAAVAAQKGLRLFKLRWLSDRHVMEVDGGGGASTFYSELVFDQIDSLRSEVESWPEEIRRKLGHVEEYLGITQQQLSLPIA